MSRRFRTYELTVTFPELLNPEADLVKYVLAYVSYIIKDRKYVIRTFELGE
jgi:hypothetical protein